MEKQEQFPVSQEPVRASEPAAAGRRKPLVQLGLVVLLSLSITTLVVIFQDELQGLSRLGYPGVFMISFLANATVIFPAPGLAFTFAMGSVLSPLLVGLVAGVGEALGEIVGYAAGNAGRNAVHKDRSYLRLEHLTRRYGAIGIAVLAAIPVGLFDVVGVIAGAMRMPVWRFLLAAWVGKTVKTVTFAYAGGYSLSWLLSLLQ